MTNETSPVQASAPAITGAGGAPARTTTSGAAKVFREFKWGLLTLFLLMVVVIGLVYDGGRKKDPAKKADAAKVEPTAGTPTGTLPNNEGLPPGLNDNSVAQNSTPGGSGLPALDRGTPPSTPTTPPRTVRTPEIQTQPPTYSGPSSIPPGGPGTGPTIRQPGSNVSATQNPTAPQEPTVAGEYTVQPGDTLEGIARKNFPGRTYAAIKAISDANSIPLPYRIRAGMKLKMPALPAQPAQPTQPTQDHAGRSNPQPTTPNPARPDARQQVAEPLTPSTPRSNVQAEEGDVYLVQTGDTLERIARKVLNDGRRWREIYEWNREQIHDPGVLRVGQKLKIKKDAATPPVEAHREPTREQPAAAPRRTVAAHDEPAPAEERSAQPQTIEHVEPTQRWMP